jgi:hypothetical protein
MALGFSAADQQKFVEKNLAVVQAQVDEPVLAYSSFYRSGSWGMLALSRLTPLGALIASQIGKRKAGGLPQNFILVLTTTRLLAFKYRPRGWTLKPGKLVGEWQSSAIHVTVDETSMTKRLTIEYGEGQKVVCDTTRGWMADNFVAALTGAPAQPIAAS